LRFAAPRYAGGTAYELYVALKTAQVGRRAVRAVVVVVVTVVVVVVVVVGVRALRVFVCHLFFCAVLPNLPS
jgi:hypothetical protein